METIFLGIGTNLGNREKNLRDAMNLIGKNIGPILKSSSIYETEPWGFESANPFLNMVVMVETTMTTAGVMEEITRIESILGRVRREEKYSSRLIDIDILLFGDVISSNTDLIIPHPMMHKRKFVLVPFCEIAPGTVHPTLKITVASILESCADKGIVKQIRGSLF